MKTGTKTFVEAHIILAFTLDYARTHHIMPANITCLDNYILDVDTGVRYYLSVDSWNELYTILAQKHIGLTYAKDRDFVIKNQQRLKLNNMKHHIITGLLKQLNLFV